VICLVLVLALGSSAEFLALRAASTDTLAAAWAAAMSPENRIESAKQLEVYRPQYQRALFFKLTLKERGEVWRFRYESFLRAHSNLTTEQVAVVQEAIDLTYQDFSQPGNTGLRDYARDVESRLLSVLGKEHAKQFVVNGGALATSAVGSMASLPMSVRARQFVVDHAAACAAAPPSMENCDCLYYAPWNTCSFSMSCQYWESGDGCIPSGDGCGIWPFLNPCFGRCRLDIQQRP